MIGEFYSAAVLAAKTPGQPAVQLAAFNSGAAVISARCQVFFRGLGLGARNLSFAQSQLQVLTGALTTVLALTNASQVAVAAVAAGSTALLAGMKQFGDNYYFSVDVASVEELVNKAQSDALEKINRSGNGPADFSSMISMLVSYQSICQPHTIRRLINVAVSNGRPVTQFPSPSVDRPPLTELYVAKLSQDLGFTIPLNDPTIAIIAAAFDGGAFSLSNFSIVCGYVVGLLPGSFSFPPGGSTTSGECPPGVSVPKDAWAAKRDNFNGLYARLNAAYPAYWGDLRNKVLAAKSAEELKALAQGVRTNSETPKGRFGGFTVTVQP
ncbi:hypothetical protein [Reyranella sp.]|uniref:hypothetical protein n=1 Tax=Reyranella sp. TaxID=1929291 RepID=UPI003F6F883A